MEQMTNVLAFNCLLADSGRATMRSAFCEVTNNIFLLSRKSLLYLSITKVTMALKQRSVAKETHQNKEARN